MSPPRRPRGLWLRIAGTFGLLAAAYVLLIAVLVAAGFGAIGAAVLSGALFIAQYFGSAPLALRALGARSLPFGEAPDLHEAVGRLARAMDVPAPDIALARTAVPAAVTVGRTVTGATLCVSAGLLDAVSGDELDAVIAHELAHIRAGDVVAMTLGGFCAAVAALLALAAPGARRRDDIAAGARDTILAILSGLVYVISWVVVQDLARHREMPADAAAAAATGRPQALACALVTIAERIERMPDRNADSFPGELAPLCLVPPRVRRTSATLFDVHPSLQDRLASLRIATGGDEGALVGGRRGDGVGSVYEGGTPG